MKTARGLLRLPVLLASALLSCAPSPPAPPARSSPDPWAGPLAVPRFTDRNPDPHIVEVDLEAREAEWEYAPGVRVHAMTYNGSVPGPLLEAQVGDTVVVHFTNRLAEPTTIHWHGVRVPNAMDGAPMVQTPVQPGASFEYRFVVPDAGTFWYHPHVHETVQLDHGLYGPIVVRGPQEPVADSEGVVMLDDLLLGPDGQLAPPGFDPLEAHGGREGTIGLLNGRTAVTVPLRAGTRQRWRVINAGSARYYRLAVPGHRLTLLGSDGGLWSAPREVDEVLVTPGDRVDVLLSGTATPGTAAVLQNLPYSRGHGNGLDATETVATLQYTSDPALVLPALPSALRAIAPLSDVGAVARSITLDEVVDPVTGETSFTINGQVFPNVPSFSAPVGSTQVWDVASNSAMDHPFHLHGFFFQVLSRDGVPEAERTWEDTVNVRGHSRMRIAFVPDGRPGMWMYHCHILEHAAGGMMADFEVTP